jgi:PAS domain S-box-containing protein
LKSAAAIRGFEACVVHPSVVASAWLTSIVGGRPAGLGDYMPHGYCYLWNPWLVWLHVVSDGLIALSYYCIPAVLIYFVRKHRDFPFSSIFWMFGGFILACGTTHVMEVWNVWHGDYLLAGIIKAATAGVSFLTAAMIVPLAPKAMALPGLAVENRSLQERIAERERTEGAVREGLAASEAALRELADQKFALDQHAIVATTDVRGAITYVNDKFCAISKYSRDELLGQNHRILNSGYHPKEFFQQMYHSIANGEVWRSEICNRAKDGSIYWVDTTIVPFLEANGKPRQYMAIRADITERKHAEEARSNLAAVVESSEDAIVAKTVEGNLTAWNPGAEKLYGYSAAEAIGQSMRMLLPPERADEETDILKRIRRGEGVEHFDTVRVRKDGSRVDVSVRISPIRDAGGRITGASNIARDITERKRAEEQLKAQAEELSRKADELARSNADLEQFAYVASHDLQEPLRMVAAYTQLLSERYSGKLDENADKFIGYAREGAIRMQVLIQDLLAFSRVGRKEDAFTNVDCNALIDEAKLALASAIQESGAVLTCGSLPTVCGDRSQMVQLFQNLIGNAIKFRGEKVPAISVSAEKKNQQWLFSVTDNGIGIAPEYAEGVFVIFQRVHARSEYPGNGIGLAICKKIVERYGGKIWVESQAGVGSTFRFTMPICAPKNAEAAHV